MGTRADFYVGRGKSAEWIGSIAWDGYPGGNPEPLVKLHDEKEYRAKVAEILSGPDGGATKPDQGWPWPWENSNTTDYAYAFDGGRVWGTCFGNGWWPADAEPEGSNEAPKDIEWPNMRTDKAAPAGSERSGIMVFGLR